MELPAFRNQNPNAYGLTPRLLVKLITSSSFSKMSLMIVIYAQALKVAEFFRDVVA